MNLSSVFSGLGFICLLSLFSCGESTSKENTKSIEISQVAGNWQVAAATRNGQATETLDGLFFRFTREGQLSTNLLGTDMEAPFELSANKILQKGETPQEYIIEKLDDKQLILVTTLEEMNFKLVLEKGK